MRARLLLPIFLILMTFLFLGQMFVGQASIPDILLVNKQIAKEQAILKTMQDRNKHLYEQIKSLRSGASELEARARLELGMIAPGEVFYEVPASS